jgi:hypothetical protein
VNNTCTSAFDNYSTTSIIKLGGIMAIKTENIGKYKNN